MTFHAIYRKLAKAEARALIEKDLLYAAICSYAPIQVHRLTSGYRFARVLPFCVSLYFSYLIIKYIFHRIFCSLVRRKVDPPNSDKYIVWMESYQYPKLDDDPLKEMAIKAGYTVVAPDKCVPALWPSLKSAVTILFRYRRCAIKARSVVIEAMDGRRSPQLSPINVARALCGKEIINRVLKAVLIDYPYLVSLTEKRAKFVIVHRHNGDLSAPLFKSYKKENREIDSTQVLLAHAGNPVSIPLSTVGVSVDYILTKNENARSVFSSREDCLPEKKIVNIGDPRVDAIRKEENNRIGCLKISFALTEKANERFFSSQGDSFLEDFISVVRFLERDASIQIKRRLPLSLSERLVSLLPSLKARALRMVTSCQLPENIAWCDFAIVVGNPNLKMVSSVLFDYIQSGVPTLVMVDSSNLDKVPEKWKGLPDGITEIIYSAESIRETLKTKGVQCLFEKASAAVRKLDVSKKPEQTAQQQFYNFLCDI